MDEHLLMMLLQLLLPIAFIVVALLFLRTQVSILELIRPENRQIAPGQVWLMLIPLFGFVWQFNLIYKITASIQKELNTQTGDSIFSEDMAPSNVKPTYFIGVSYAILICIALIPIQLIKGPAMLVSTILWIIYWVQLGRFKKKIMKRALLSNTSV